VNNQQISVVTFPGNDGKPDISLVIPPGLAGTEENNELDVAVTNFDRQESDVISITLRDQFGNSITQLTEPLTICLKQTGKDNADDLCLGYLNDDREWECEDCSLKESEDSLYCGETGHLTNFALLLQGDDKGNKCGDDGFNSVLAWLSLSFVILAILMVAGAILGVEIYFRYHLRSNETMFRTLGEAQSRHMSRH